MCKAAKLQNYLGNLPVRNNSRWEALFTSFRTPVQARRKSIPPTKKISSKRPTTTGYEREAIGSKLRYDILTRDGYRCVKCGAKGSDTRLHIDHKIPVSRGGTNVPLNLQTLCERCNLGKGPRIG